MGPVVIGVTRIVLQSSLMSSLIHARAITAPARASTSSSGAGTRPQLLASDGVGERGAECGPCRIDDTLFESLEEFGVVGFFEEQCGGDGRPVGLDPFALHLEKRNEISGD